MNKYNFIKYIDPISREYLNECEGFLYSQSGNKYVIKNSIPRFVKGIHYSDDFGIQWTNFSKTQIDSFNGTNLSYQRLSRIMNGFLDRLNGKNILEVGSGSGRFTEILASKGGIINTIDSSNAIDVNFNNNSTRFNNILYAQADLYNCPFNSNSFDFVVCIGVVQHTPSPELTIRKLYELVKPGGHLILDHYLFKLRNILPPPIGIATNLYRPCILNFVKKENRLFIVEKIVKFWFPIHWKFRNYKLVQRILRRVSPVHFYWGNLQLNSKEQYLEYALLDTHDSLTDKFKHHKTLDYLNKFIKSLGAINLNVSLDGNGIEIICKKPPLNNSLY